MQLESWVISMGPGPRYGHRGAVGSDSGASGKSERGSRELQEVTRKKKRLRSVWVYSGDIVLT